MLRCFQGLEQNLQLVVVVVVVVDLEGWIVARQLTRIAALAAFDWLRAHVHTPLVENSDA